MKNKFSLLSMIIPFVLLFVCSNNVLAQAPVNDDCNNALFLPITIDSTCFESTNVNATASIAPLPSGPETGYNGGDIWFSFVAPESGRVIIHTNSLTTSPTITEGGMALYSGNCGPTLTQLALSIEGVNGSLMPRIDTDDFDIVLTEGDTYYIRFWSYDNVEHGTFNLCIWTIPIVAGNTCAEATPLYPQFDCTYREFHNLYSTASTGVPNPPCGSYSSGYSSTGDVWFSAVVPPNGHLIIKTAESDNAQTLTDCAMALYRGTCTSLTRIACEDDTPEIPLPNPMPTIDKDNLVPGEIVYIRFWDKGCNARGYFNICVYTPRPVNDDCINAIPLDAPMANNCTYQNFTNYGATNAAGMPGPGCGNYQGGDIWFTVSVEAGKRIVVTTEWGDIFSAGLALYSGECAALELLQCVGSTGVMPEISMQGFAEDQTLYVRFWSIGNIEQGTFGICAYTTEEIGVNMGDSTVCHSLCNEFDPLIICDDGGSDDYGHNRHDTLTIYSQDLEEGFIALKFLEMDIDSTDTLFIYNGPTADPQYLTYEIGNKHASWVNNSNIFGLGEETGLTITAFWPNSSGAITLRFKTGGTGVGTGFRLRSSCSVLCQPINVNVTAMDESIEYFSTGEPVGVLYEGGNTYVNLCPMEFPKDTITDSLNFYGIVNYPFSDTIYHQDNSTSLFTWRFGSEIISGFGLDQVTRCFSSGRGTAVSLTVTDTVGCIAPNIAAYRIRTSQNPIKSLDHLAGANVCAGESYTVTFGYESVNSVILDPIGDEQISSLGVTDTIFLPDGENCPPTGYFYRSPVTFDAFSATDFIESAEDIYSVCVNMEHSYIGDIRISLECPNGNSVMLLPDYQTTGWPSTGTTSTWLGEANELDDSGNGCDGSQYSMGNGWNYCWSNNSDQGYVYSTSPNGYIYENANIISHLNQFHNTNKSTVDSTNKAEMSQVYHPVESFENLVGCPMNGTWFIEVEDTWGIDNGFLFGWDLSLAPRLMPQAWDYEIKIDSIIPIGPFINENFATDTSFVIEPSSTTPEGDYEYSFTIIDDYGCVFTLDSTFTLTIHQAYASNYEDEICHGVPYDNYGFFIANPPISSIGSDTTIYLSKFDLQTVEFGCDSSLNLALTIHPNKETFFEGSICIGETYNANGFNVTGYASGEWIYRNIGTTANGCDTIATLNLDVLPTPQVEIIGVTNLCLGSSTTLTASGCIGDNCSFLWSTGETTSSIEVSPTEDTYYSVTLSTADQCTGFDEVTVSVSNYLNPDVHIEGDFDITCGDPTTLTAVDNNNVAAYYIWRKNGEIMEGENGPSITVIPTEATVYAVSVSTEHDCSGVANATVVVTPTTVGINASATAIHYSESTTLTANNLTGVPSTYVWTWDGNTETGESITVSPTENTTYHLEATTIDGGCKATAEITITVTYIFAAPDDVDPEFFNGVDVDSSCRAIVYWMAPDPIIMQAGGVFIGYNVYRDNILLTPTPIQADSLLDIQLSEGIYTYCVSCVYETGTSEKVCGTIEFVPEYNAPTMLSTSRTENCEASLAWNTPSKNCWANLNGFYIYRNDKLIDSVYISNNVAIDTLFTDSNIGENRFNYCVQAFYQVNGKTRLSDKICTMVNTCFDIAVNVFPNPVDQELTVTANEMERIMIYDESGRFIHQIDVPETSCRTIKISTAHLANGVHLFHIYMRGGISTIKRVVIMH